MRVQTEEWQRFIPGVRMYKGKKTLFWNGEMHSNGIRVNCSKEDLDSVKAIIVLPGVEEIPAWAFAYCKNVEAVIMSDSVRRIWAYVFSDCRKLSYVRLSINLEYIGNQAFKSCYSLTSFFIPASCREIGRWTFSGCKKLIILSVPQHTRLGWNAIGSTALIEASPFKRNVYGNYENPEEVHEWVKSINQGEEYELHRACSSFNPLMDIIYGIIKRKGPSIIQQKNEIGMTPFDYLEANSSADIGIDQKALMKQYVMEMMGETVFNNMYGSI